MPEITNYEIIKTIESSTPPVLSPMKVGTATLQGHAINKQYLETLAPSHLAVQTVQNARDIPPAERVDKQTLIVDDLPNAFFKFDAASSNADDGGSTCIAPTTGTGRWLNVIPVSSSGVNYSAYAAEAINGSGSPKSVCLKVEKTLTVTNSNRYLPIKENGGAEILITIPNLTYLVSDLGTGDTTYDLCKVLENLLNNDGATTGVYTVSYSLSTRLINITVVGLTTFSITIKTGTVGSDNLDTHIGTLLGYDDSADLTGALTYTAANIVETQVSKKLFCYMSDTDSSFKKYCHGFVTSDVTKCTYTQIDFVSSVNGFPALIEGEEYYTGATPGIPVSRANTNINSQYCGFAQTTSSLVVNQTGIKPIQNANNWKTTPTTYDATADISFHCQHENANGYGVRIYSTPTATSATYHIQYKNGAGAAWTEATTTIAMGNNTDPQFSGNFNRRSKCFVDENNVGILALWVVTGSYPVIKVYDSSDLDNWTVRNGGSPLTGEVSYVQIVHDIYARENHCLVVFSKVTAGQTYFAYSENTGSGYVTWTVADTGYTFDTNYSVTAFIQYFSGEAGINQFRYLAIGYSTDRPKFIYCKEDLSGITLLTGINEANYIVSTSRDATNNGFSFMAGGAAGSRKAGYIGKVYNSGTLQVYDYSLADISGGTGGTTVGYNGYSSDGSGAVRYFWNDVNRGVLLNDRVFFVTQEISSSSYTQAVLYSNFAMANGGSWTRTVLGKTSNHNQEICIAHVPSIDTLIVAFKHNDNSALSNNLTYGQIYTQAVELTGTSLTVGAIEQIDGLKISTPWAGLLTITGNNSGVSASWMQYLTSYNLLKDNAFV